MRRTYFKSGTYIIHSIFVFIKELLRNLRSVICRVSPKKEYPILAY